MAKARISIGTWAYLFNQKEPTNDFHTIIHKLQDLGYDGVELGSFGPHPSPVSHPTKAKRAKLKKEIADQRDRFVSGAVERGVDQHQAEAIFELLAKFAEYGFPKGHAAAYALVTYQTAYMKANYPV